MLKAQAAAAKDALQGETMIQKKPRRNHTLWLFNIAMENGPFIDDFPIEPSIYKGFSMAMLNNQMVIQQNQMQRDAESMNVIQSGTSGKTL